MLRVAVNWLELAENSINHARGLFGVDFALLSEINTTNPFVLDLLEGRFQLEDSGQLVKVIPEHLKLPIEIMILGGLANIGEVFDFAVSLFDFEPFLSLFVGLELLPLGFRVNSLRRHSVT